MPFLEIQHHTGDNERRPLSKQSAVTIGSHSSCDVQIDEEIVEVMHCRISWSKQGFEAVAAGVEPLDCNGAPVRKAVLKAGDVLRFGSVDVRFREGEEDGAAEEVPDSMLGLKPISEDIQRRQIAPPTRAEIPKPGGQSGKKRPVEEPELTPDAFLSALDSLADESAFEPAKPVARKPRPAPLTRGPAAPPPEAAPVAPPSPAVEPAPATGAAAAADGLSDRMRQAMHARQKHRPGEEDILRSPLVLGLGGGAIVLLLATAIFYFIGHRQTTQQEFNVAKTDFDSGNYITAIKALDEFVMKHPRDPLTDDARQLSGAAGVLQQISGAAPDFKEGLAKLRAFIDQQRDLDGFELLQPDLATYARTIALGAATAAGRVYDPALLETSNQAKALLQSYTPKNSPPTESLAQIQVAYRTSEAAILRDDVYQDHLTKIDAALNGQHPRDALRLRRDLLVRYPQFITDRKLSERTAKTLGLERSLAKSFELPLVPARDDHRAPLPTLNLVFQGRTRTDELAVGKAVVVTGGDSVYGLEFVTGQPLWRRVTGRDLPFFPILDDRSGSVFLNDALRQEIVKIDQATGQLRWRLPLQEKISGRPLLTSDALYVPTASGKLLSLDLESGSVTSAIAFTQPVSGPVELPGGQRLVVAGHEEVLYTLTKRPFAVEAVFDLGQAAGSIRAPLLAMGNYLLLIENGEQRASAQLLRIAGASQDVSVAATGTVAGPVLDDPVIRGRDLFVPFSGEGVAAFALSDDAGQPPLTAGPVFQGKGTHQGPAFLLTGPERQLWMATGGLQRLRLSTDSLQPESDATAIGFASQPLRSVSGYLFHGRRRPYSQGVTLTRTDRETLASDWQVVVSSPLLAVAGRGNTGTSNFVAVNDGGQVFRAGERQFSGGAFLSETTARLPLHPDLVDPLFAGRLANDRLGVSCAGPEPKLWLINAAGQIESSLTLPSVPQAAAIQLGNEILAPLQGRMHVIRQAGRPAVQEFVLPTGQAGTWVNALPLSGTMALGVLREGSLIALRLSEGARPTLEEKARIELGAPVRFPAATGNGLVVVADANQRLRVYQGEQLEPRGDRTFGKGISAAPRIAGDKIFVEEAGELHCVDPVTGLPTLWSLPLEGARVTDVLLVNSQLLIGLRRGEVWRINPQTGQVLSREPCGEQLDWGPQLFGETLLGGSRDGSLIRLQ